MKGQQAVGAWVMPLCLISGVPVEDIHFVLYGIFRYASRFAGRPVDSIPHVRKIIPTGGKNISHGRKKYFPREEKPAARIGVHEALLAARR